MDFNKNKVVIANGMWSSCSFHIAQNMSHGTGNLFLAHEPLSDTDEYWPKRGKEVKEGREVSWGNE